MKKSQFETLIREVIRETIRKVDGKYVVYPEKGGKRLGTHSTKAAAEKQLTAIHLNKEAVEPKFEFEWEEAVRYPEFKKLGKNKWIELAKTGKAITITSAEDINNTDANEPDAFKTLDPNKQKRALAQLKSGNVEMPIVAVYSDGYKELVGGNTRLTAMMAQNGKATIWQFEVPDEILDENYADGKVAEVKQEATDSMAVVFDRNGADLFLYDITAKQILGYINVYNNNVTGVAAKKGYGPLMYELGMAHVYPNALQSDRNGNTEPEAKAVWEKFIAGANPKIKVVKLSPSDKEYRTKYPNGNEIWESDQFYNYKFYNPDTSTLKKLIANGDSLSSEEKDKIIKSGNDFYHSLVSELSKMKENYADGKVKGKSRPGRVKKAGASCKGSVTDLRAKAKKYSGEKGKMYHWCANMKAGKR